MIDSLLNVLKSAKEDTTKVNTLNILGMELSYRNPDTSSVLAHQALSLSEKAASKKHIADSYHAIGWADFKKGNYPDALKYYFDALKIYETTQHKQGIAAILINIGSIYQNQSENPKALDYFFRALELNEELGNKKGIASTLGNIGNVYFQQGEHPKALDYFLKSLKMNEEHGDKRGIAYNHGNIGNVYLSQGDFPKALDYYFKLLKASEELGDKIGTQQVLGNIGLVYYHQSDGPNALDYFFKTLKLAEELGRKEDMATVLGNIGLVYEYHGEYPKALDYYSKALKIAEEIDTKEGIARHLTSIGIVYTETGKFAEAEVYLKKANVIFDRIGALIDLSQTEKSLSKLYNTTGRYKLALEHYKKAMVLKDTLFNQEKNAEITRKEMNYEFEKKEQAAKAEQDIKDALTQQQIQKQRVLKNSFLGGLALVLVLFYFIYNNYRTRQKLKLETIRNNIAADLHDDIGSTLNSISLFSEVAKQEAGRPIPALDQIGVSARKIIDAMSDIVWTINPENDTFENVIARMRSLSYMLLKAKGIEFVFKANESLNTLSLPMLTRKNVYLLFKEAINNMVKYSNASSASFNITLENKKVHLVIRDNGVGFDTENALMGNGIKNMKRRAGEIGAQILIESSVGQGTNIELNFRA